VRIPDWTATVVIAILALAVAWLALRTQRTQAGYRKPILMSRPKVVGQLRFPDDLQWDRLGEADRNRRRRVQLHLFNQSDALLVLTINPDKSSVLWPRYPVRVFVEARHVNLDPHTGGNVDLIVTSETVEWPDKLDWPKRRYLLRVSGSTAGGRPVRFLGWVPMRPLRVVIG
jgi:hypothetical protein